MHNFSKPNCLSKKTKICFQKKMPIGKRLTLLLKRRSMIRDILLKLISGLMLKGKLGIVMSKIK